MRLPAPPVRILSNNLPQAVVIYTLQMYRVFVQIAMGLSHTWGDMPITGVFCSVFSYSHTEKFPCGNGLVKIVPCRSLMVCTIHTSHPIVISYLIDSRCLSSMSLLARAPVCLHAMSVLRGTSRGELVCHRLVLIVISPMSPYCAWC